MYRPTNHFVQSNSHQNVAGQTVERFRRLLTTGMALLVLAAVVEPQASYANDNDDNRTPEELFEQRIMPIFRSTKPSSCVQCHLSSVDLKDYILPSHEATFAALRNAELIDVNEPGESRILELIRMGMKEQYQANADGPRISNKIREQELAAFTAWIQACCDDETLLNLEIPKSETEIGPEKPEEVIRHNRLDRITDAFERNIWSLRFRCANCHMKSGYNYENFEREHGDKMAWLKEEGPRATVEYLIDSDLVDVDEPENSMLLLKPLNEVKHGGGVKMARRDTDYMTFLTWIEDYSKSYLDLYETADALPNTAQRRGSEIWLRVQGLPKMAHGMTGLISVHAADQAGGWQQAPAAVASVNVRQTPRLGTFAQGFLMIETPADAPDLPLAAGKYQVRMLFDRERDTSIHDFDTAFDSATEIARVEVESEWKPGFKNVTVANVADGDAIELPASVTIGREIEVTKRRCKAVIQATKLMYSDTGAYPKAISELRNPTDETVRTWRGPYLENESVPDAWGHEIELRNNRRRARPVEREKFGDFVQVIALVSPGPDGIFNTGDDVREIYQTAGE